MGLHALEGRPAVVHAGSGLREEDRLRALLVLRGDRRGPHPLRRAVPGAAAADLVRGRRLRLRLGQHRGHRSRLVPAKLYVLPASHPSMAAELMLKRKGVDYKRRDLIFLM